jgi:predicted DNA-binding transcriptional regulator AlpA
MSAETGTSTVQEMPMPALLLSIPDAAGLLKVSPRGLWRMIGTGRFGPAVLPFGRLTRIRRNEFTDWLNAGAPPARPWKWKGA